MINTLLLLICIVITFELWKSIGLKENIIIIYDVSRRIFWSLRLQKVSDIWIQKFLIGYALKLMKICLLVTTILIVTFFLFLLISFIEKSFFEFLISKLGLAISFFFILIYSYMRRKIFE
jgi:hypothetical protein